MPAKRHPPEPFTGNCGHFRRIHARLPRVTLHPKKSELPMHRYRRYLAILFVLALSLTLGLPDALCSPDALLTPSERQWLEEHADRIILAPTPNYPPVDFFNSEGVHSGIAADIFRQIEEHIGYTFTRKQSDTWQDILDSAKARTIDITTIAQKTPERQRFWLFTEPYLKVPTVIVTRKNGQKNLSLDKLAGMNVAIVKGYAINDYLAEHHPELSLTPVPDDLTGLQKVAFGELDALIADLPAASYLISEWGITNLRIAGNTGYVYEYAIASRKDWPILNRILEKGLATITPETRKSIIAKWISYDQRSFPWIWVFFVIGSLTLFLAGFLIWNRILARAVRHRTEALALSENKFRALFDASPYSITVSDLTGRYLMVNPAFEAFTGLTYSELVGRTAGELGIFEDPPVNSPHRDAFEADGRLDNLEISFKHADDGSGSLLYSSRRIDFGGNPAILSIAVDNTENKRTIEALRHKNQQFEGIAANLPGLVYQFYATRDGKRGVSYVSDGTEEILGISYDPEHFFAQFLEHIDPRDQPSFSATIKEAVEHVSNWHFEGRYNKPSGETLWFTGMSSPVVKDDRIEFNGIILDITRQKEAEEHLRQAQHMETVGRLAAGVAHDFNNMLSPILGYAELLSNKFDPSDAGYAQLQQIRLAAERARDLTHQLLAYGRKQMLQVKPVDLNGIVTGMEKLLLRTLRENIELQVHMHPEPCVITADTGQVEQILMNLVINAQDAMPEGGKLRIEVTRQTVGNKRRDRFGEILPGSYGVLIISDTGHGMEDAVREKIFEPFFSTKGQLDYGLGLAMVHGIVKQHGGAIRVDSAPGRGAAFTIYLPAAQQQLPADETPDREIRPARGSETVLLVEDNEMVRNLTNSILESEGYTVLSAGGGAEALDLLERHTGSIDLLLTDVVLPRTTGKALYEQVRGRIPGIRVLYMSGYPKDIIARHGILDDNIAFIRKPFSVHQLTAKIREILNSRKAL